MTGPSNADKGTLANRYEGIVEGVKMAYLPVRRIASGCEAHLLLRGQENGIILFGTLRRSSGKIGMRQRLVYR